MLIIDFLFSSLRTTFVLMMKDWLGDLLLSGDKGEDLNMEVGVEGTQGNLNLCLVGRILIDKVVNFNMMKHRFAGIWRLMEG